MLYFTRTSMWTLLAFSFDFKLTSKTTETFLIVTKFDFTTKNHRGSWCQLSSEIATRIEYCFYFSVNLPSLLNFKIFFMYYLPQNGSKRCSQDYVLRFQMNIWNTKWVSKNWNHQKYFWANVSCFFPQLKTIIFNEVFFLVGREEDEDVWYRGYELWPLPSTFEFLALLLP